MLYLISAIIIFCGIIFYINCVLLRNPAIEKAKFKNSFFNLLYLSTYMFPIFIFMRSEDKLSKKEKSLKDKLRSLGLEDKFTINSYLALRFILFFLCISVYIAIVALMKSVIGEAFEVGDTMIWLALLFIVPFIPDFIIKNKEKQKAKFYGSQVSLLQLFTILMIKSNATIEEVLYAFSKINTFYKGTFQKGYRICLRSKKDALFFLEQEFSETEFKNTFSILNSMFSYSKEDCIRILESNMRSMEEQNMNEKRKKDMNKFAYAQMSIVAPFMVVVFLGAVPVIQYGMSIITEAIGNI